MEVMQITIEGNPTYRDWEDEPIVSVVPIGSGRAETTQNIMDSTDIYKSRTLYVLLRRKVQESPSTTRRYHYKTISD